MVTRSYARQKGSNHERSIADWLQENWSRFIDRRVKTGAKDKGDIANFILGDPSNGRGLVVECKNESAFNLAGWVKEAQEEAINDGAVAGIVVAKRPRHGSPEDQYVITTLGDFINILNAHR